MKIRHPYHGLSDCEPLRGNLHTHTTRSDGQRDPQAVIDDYAERGYDFLMLSDHDVCTTPDGLGEFDDRGMVLLPGNEISANGPHLLHVGGHRKALPHSDRQAAIDEAVADQGFIIAAHPNWGSDFDHTSTALLHQWRGYRGVEIYNGVIGRLHGSPYATGKWDQLLTAGREVWGFANDDSHRAGPSDVELGWNVAWCRSRTPQAVIEALKEGRFYASTGVNIIDIRIEGDRIYLTTENAEQINALQQTGRRFAVSAGSTIEVTVPADARYVRFECFGPGETMAWTQPCFSEAD